jgi:stage IV sporulation protein FB
VLAEPGRTPYDLHFRLFGFRLRIHPFFWIGAGLLGASELQHSFAKWLIWIAIVFVSILIHELGHAFTYRLFGCNASIVLYAFGGLAIPDSAVYRRFRRILITLAGPFAGFAFAALVFASDLVTQWGSSEKTGDLIAFLWMNLIVVNVFWGIFNLLPVFPLDGGQIARELCEAKWRGRGLKISLQISVWVAVAIASYSLLCQLEVQTGRRQLLDVLPRWFPRGDLFTAVLFILLAIGSYQMLQQIGRGMYYDDPDDRLPWEK